MFGFGKASSSRERLAGSGDELFGEVGIGQGAVEEGFVGHELGKEVVGFNAGVADGGDHMGDAGSGVLAEGKRVAGEEE